MPIISLIIQAAFLTLFFVIVILLVVFSSLLQGKARKKLHNDTEDERESSSSTNLEDAIESREEKEETKERPIYEKYPQIYRFEILYWRGVSKPWWWNNYAKELVEYANEYFPWNRVEYYSSYNSNSKSEDYNDPLYHDRIVSLRPHKRSKHPLVVINYDQEYIMVDNYYALEEMKDRIDAEWLRHYGLKKTYRRSPTTYVP